LSVPAPSVPGGSFADLAACLQALEVPGELGCRCCGDAWGDYGAVECSREVGQGGGDDLLGLAGCEGVPAFGFPGEVGGADAAVLEAAVDGEDAVAGEVEDGEVLGMGVVVTEEDGEGEPAQELGDRSDTR